MEYSLNANSWHVKLYKLLWNNGVDPTYRYNTMCPYFWMSILGVVISPLLMLRTLLLALRDGIAYGLDKLESKIEGSKVDKWLTLLDTYMTDYSEEDMKRFIEEHGFDRDRIYSALYRKGKPDLYYNFDAIDDQVRYERKVRCQERAAKRKETFDKIVYNRWVSKGLAGLGVIAGLGVAYLIYLFFYWLLHLFTFKEFLGVLIIIGAIALGAAIAFLLINAIVYGVLWLIGILGLDSNKSRKRCNSWFKTLVINPLKSVGRVLVIIIKGLFNFIEICVDMIRSIYNRSCPRVTWNK